MTDPRKPSVHCVHCLGSGIERTIYGFGPCGCTVRPGDEGKEPDWDALLGRAL